MTLDSTVSDPKPFRILVDEAMILARRFFRQIYPSVAIPVSLLSLVFFVIQTVWMKEFFAVGARPKPEMSRMFLGCAGSLVAILAMIVVHTLANTAMIAACVDVVGGKSVDMRRSWRFVFHGRVLWTFVLVWIAIMLGLVLLILPGLYLILVLSLTPAVMASEGLFGGAALSRSAQLVRYNPQRRFIANPKTKVAALFLISWLLSVIVGLLINLPFLIIRGFVMARQIAGETPWARLVTPGPLWLQIPSNFLGSLASMAIAVYVNFGLALLYFDIRRRKEGIDLEAAIARLAVGQTAPAAGPSPAS